MVGAGMLLDVSALWLSACGIAILLAWFASQEMLKKFVFMTRFVHQSGQLLTWHYAGAKATGRKRGMRKIVLRAPEQFSVLIGFDLRLPVSPILFDYYGQVNAENGTVVFETFLGTGEVDFRFLVSCDPSLVTVSDAESDQWMTAVASYPPHFIQRLGFWG